MKETIDAIKTAYAAFEKNTDALLTKENKAAGVRARKTTLELEKLFKQFRKESLGK